MNKIKSSVLSICSFLYVMNRRYAVVPLLTLNVEMKSRWHWFYCGSHWFPLSRYSSVKRAFSSGKSKPCHDSRNCNDLVVKT